MDNIISNGSEGLSLYHLGSWEGFDQLKSYFTTRNVILSAHFHHRLHSVYGVWSAATHHINQSNKDVQLLAMTIV